MADTCYVCGREATAQHALDTCDDCAENICWLHTQAYDGEDLCPDCYYTACSADQTTLQAAIQAKIDTPAELDSWEDVEAEILVVWQKMKDAVDIQACCLENLLRLMASLGGK